MSANCPFHFHEHPRPSIFATDLRFTCGASSKKTMSHISSASVARITRETGKNPGSIDGLSSAGDRLIAAGQDQRALKKKRA